MKHQDAGSRTGELQKIGVCVADIKEVRWPSLCEPEFKSLNPIANTSLKYKIYHSGSDKSEKRVGFIVTND